MVAPAEIIFLLLSSLGALLTGVAGVWLLVKRKHIGAGMLFVFGAIVNVFPLVRLFFSSTSMSDFEELSYALSLYLSPLLIGIAAIWLVAKSVRVNV